MLYEGTRLGRQELRGAMILDPANALFKDHWLIIHDVPEEMISRSPSASIRLVAATRWALWLARCSMTDDMRCWRTGLRSEPGAVGEAVVKCHDDFDADDGVVEINFGSDMATEVVKQAAERGASTRRSRIEPDPHQRGLRVTRQSHAR